MCFALSGKTTTDVLYVFKIGFYRRYTGVTSFFFFFKSKHFALKKKWQKEAEWLRLRVQTRFVLSFIIHPFILTQSSIRRLKDLKDVSVLTGLDFLKFFHHRDISCPAHT